MSDDFTDGAESAVCTAADVTRRIGMDTTPDNHTAEFELLSREIAATESTSTMIKDLPLANGRVRCQMLLSCLEQSYFLSKHVCYHLSFCSIGSCQTLFITFYAKFFPMLSLIHI